MSLKNKSVLVTGGCGFIGSHLVEHLCKNDVECIIVVDNLFLGKIRNIDSVLNDPRVTLKIQDASDYERMKLIFSEFSVDVVFNLAVIPLPASLIYPKITCEDNVKITLTSLELQREGFFKTFIQCSSSEAYGSALSKRMDEKHPMLPTTPYAASKAASDMFVQTYWNTFGGDTIIVRPYNNYGPRQNERSYAGIIPLTIKRILDGEKPIIYGDGLQTRDYIYVDDTAQSFIDVYNHQNTRGKSINIATGNEISILDMVKVISNELNYSGGFIFEQERKGDLRRHCADISLAQKLIGFSPKTSFNAGIKKTIDWYKSLFSYEVKSI